MTQRLLVRSNCDSAAVAEHLVGRCRRKTPFAPAGSTGKRAVKALFRQVRDRRAGSLEGHPRRPMAPRIAMRLKLSRPPESTALHERSSRGTRFPFAVLHACRRHSRGGNTSALFFSSTSAVGASSAGRGADPPVINRRSVIPAPSAPPFRLRRPTRSVAPSGQVMTTLKSIIRHSRRRLAGNFGVTGTFSEAATTPARLNQLGPRGPLAGLRLSGLFPDEAMTGLQIRTASSQASDQHIPGSNFTGSAASVTPNSLRTQASTERWFRTVAGLSAAPTVKPVDAAGPIGQPPPARRT